MKHLLSLVTVCITALLPATTPANINESFTVTTHNVEVKQSTASSIELRSDSNAYSIKLEPHRTGDVIFSLSGIGYTSTMRISHLAFRVKITGFGKNGIVYPVFSLDDINNDVYTKHNAIYFEHIQGSIPVWFNESVDSINLEYSNSHSVHINQYLSIRDLKIIESSDIVPNPKIVACQENDVMVAIDGSSSISKNERKIVGRQFIKFVRESQEALDIDDLSVFEFGSDIKSTMESTERKALVRAFKNYKRRKYKKYQTVSWTNWSVAFDEAIKRKPELFIFITDGWSNWANGGPSSFTAVYRDLAEKCNTIKENGTRLLIITSDMDMHKNSKSILSDFLNGTRTVELNVGIQVEPVDLKNVDLITMHGFDRLDEIDLSSIVRCPAADLETDVSFPKN